MRERPILFSGPMVRALFAGKKTQTRRVYRPRSPEPYELMGEDESGKPWPVWMDPNDGGDYLPVRCPYGEPGDRLWVREKWCPDLGHFGHSIAYAAEYEGGERERPMSSSMPSHERQVWIERWERKHGGWSAWSHAGKWSPGIYLPRWASRLTLEVEAVRVERLMALTEADAAAEGMDYSKCGHPDCGPTAHGRVGTFGKGWDALNGKRGFGWATNPWVWVVTFKRVGAA